MLVLLTALLAGYVHAGCSSSYPQGKLHRKFYRYTGSVTGKVTSSSLFDTVQGELSSMSTYDSSQIAETLSNPFTAVESDLATFITSQVDVASPMNHVMEFVGYYSPATEPTDLSFIAFGVVVTGLETVTLSDKNSYSYRLYVNDQLAAENYDAGDVTKTTTTSRAPVSNHCNRIKLVLIVSGEHYLQLSNVQFKFTANSNDILSTDIKGHPSCATTATTVADTFVSAHHHFYKLTGTMSSGVNVGDSSVTEKYRMCLVNHFTEYLKNTIKSTQPDVEVAGSLLPMGTDATLRIRFVKPFTDTPPTSSEWDTYLADVPTAMLEDFNSGLPAASGVSCIGDGTYNPSFSAVTKSTTTHTYVLTIPGGSA